MLIIYNFLLHSVVPEEWQSWLSFLTEHEGAGRLTVPHAATLVDDGASSRKARPGPGLLAIL